MEYKGWSIFIDETAPNYARVLANRYGVRFSLSTVKAVKQRIDEKELNSGGTL